MFRGRTGSPRKFNVPAYPKTLIQLHDFSNGAHFARPHVPLEALQCSTALWMG